MPIPSYTTPKQAKMCEGGQPEPKGHEYGWDKPCRSKLDGENIHLGTTSEFALCVPGQSA